VSGKEAQNKKALQRRCGDCAWYVSAGSESKCSAPSPFWAYENDEFRRGSVHRMTDATDCECFKEKGT